MLTRLGPDWKKYLKQYLLITLGAIVYAVGQNIFIRPLHIPLGGVTGIALIINYLTQLPVGMTNLVLNIPLLILGYRTLGRGFFVKTIYGTVVVSVAMDTVGLLLTYSYQGDLLLAALFGGVIMGAGGGLILRQGGSAGGLDIIGKYVNKKRDMPMGNVSLMINVFIIGGSALIYQNLESAMYAMVTSFLYNTVVDRMLYGADMQKKAMIVTDRPAEVAEAIMAKLGKGVTSWDGKGMYTGNRRTVLMCAVHRYETSVLKGILEEVDADSLLLLSELTEVFGTGFKRYKE